jgi:DNA-binding NtrC family response regulator
MRLPCIEDELRRGAAEMRLGDTEVAQAETILIAVGDGVLADSLRFSLELEGFETRFCEEHSLRPALRAPCLSRACLVVDQDVFLRVVEAQGAGLFADNAMPVILMVSQPSRRLLTNAEAARVTLVVEKPLLGGVLLDAIDQVLHNGDFSGRTPPSF